MTYIPQHFRVSDEHTLQEFMRTYDFATVVSGSPDGLMTSHLPVLVRPSGATLVIVGHMARANHHWRLMDGASSGTRRVPRPSWLHLTDLVRDRPGGTDVELRRRPCARTPQSK